MKQRALSELLTLSGKVVEIYERDGLSRARVSLNPCCLEVLADPSTELHLGDKVTVDAQIKTTAVRPASIPAE